MIMKFRLIESNFAARMRAREVYTRVEGEVDSFALCVWFGLTLRARDTEQREFKRERECLVNGKHTVGSSR